MRLLAMFLACLVVFTSCASPFGPSSNVSNTFTWTVDGAHYQADKNGIVASHSTSGNISLNGFSCMPGPGLSLAWSGLTPGTYTSQDFQASWTPDAKAHWDSSSTAGPGSLTITAISATRVTGRFSAEMVPRVGNPVGGNRSVFGTFDLAFDNRTLC